MQAVWQLLAMTLEIQFRYCGCGSDLTVDHIKPVSKGGLWEWSNLVTACNKCNGKKGSKTLKQLGWKLKRIPTVRFPLSFLCLCVFAYKARPCLDVIIDSTVACLLVPKTVLFCVMAVSEHDLHGSTGHAGSISMASWRPCGYEPQCSQFTKGGVPALAEMLQQSSYGKSLYI